MSWLDNFPYPHSADRNGDGDVDFNERAEYDYMYDSIMGTNMSGFCPENDEDDSCPEDDDDFFDNEDEEKDEDELAGEYSDRLDFEDITEADWDGYYTSDGTFNDWEIDDMFDYSDDEGFWDKCGNYHEYVPADDDIDGSDNTDYDGNSDAKYFADIDLSKVIRAKGRWIDNTCFIYGRKNHDDYIGAYCNGEFFPYSVRGDWREPDPPGLQDELSKEELYKKVSGLVNSKFADKMAMYIKGTSAYEGGVGFWYDDILYFADFNDKYIGVITKDEFIPLEEYYKNQQTESNPDDETFEFNEDNLIKDIDSFFSESSKTAEPEITFSNSPAGKMFAAAYDKFPELENYLTPKDFEEGFSTLTGKVYSKNRPLAADCWAWIVTSYADKLLNDPDFGHLTDEYFRYIPSNMFNSDDNDRYKFIQHYIAERPELMEILFSKAPYDRNNSAPFEFLGWSIVRNDFTSFEKAYFMLLNNEKWVSAPPKKEDIIEEALNNRECFARNQSSEKFYVFFKEEIKTIEHAGKRQHLNDILKHRLSYGFPFAKPSTEQQYSRILQDIPSIKDNVPAENISQKPAQCKKAASSAEMVSKEKAPEEKAPEEKASTAVIERDADINTELHVLYERKRVLEALIAEIDIKIEKLESCSATKDEFFTNAEVVGMKYYDRSDGELVIGTKLTLVRDLENEYDSNAVAVYDDKNRKVGFITKRTNSPLAKDLDNGRKLYAKVSSTPIPDHYPNMKIEVFEEK